jgi:hypothetical protein
MVSLDIEAAFDKVPYPELLFKLNELKQPVWLIKLLRSYYENRTFHVKIKNKISQNKRISAGTAQGAIISPCLYSLYISDMPHSDYTYQYADDTAFIFRDPKRTEAEREANSCLERLSKWCTDWKTKINASKSQAMSFQQTDHANRITVRYNQEIIPKTKEIKYLGILIDKDLTFSAHTRNVIEKDKAKFRTLSRWLQKKKIITIQTKEILYKSLVLPSLLYGLPVWDQARKI